MLEQRAFYVVAGLGTIACMGRNEQPAMQIGDIGLYKHRLAFGNHLPNKAIELTTD